jgi:Fucosyltransferase, N-terminal
MIGYHIKVVLKVAFVVAVLVVTINFGVSFKSAEHQETSNNTVLKSELVYSEVDRNRSEKVILLWRRKWKRRTSEKVNNCLFTENRELLSNVHDFDAIRFEFELTGKNLRRMKRPATRSPHQNYIMCSLE